MQTNLLVMKINDDAGTKEATRNEIRHTTARLNCKVGHRQREKRDCESDVRERDFNLH